MYSFTGSSRVCAGWRLGVGGGGEGGGGGGGGGGGARKTVTSNGC